MGCDSQFDDCYRHEPARPQTVGKRRIPVDEYPYLVVDEHGHVVIAESSIDAIAQRVLDKFSEVRP